MIREERSILRNRLADIQITDSFWSYYQDLVRNVVLPYQWEALNDRIPDAEPSGAISNFKSHMAIPEHHEFPCDIVKEKHLCID
jgi:DUF1680 family protein